MTTTTITSGGTTITPGLVLGYETETASRNVVHNILGASSPAVTLAPESLRTGTLQLFFATEAAAFAAQALHRAGSSFVLASTDIPAANMTYVRTAAMSLKLDEDTMKVWTLAVGYQEVS